MGINNLATPRNEPSASARHRLSEADALFSTTQQRVMGLLFGQPDRSFFAREIIDRLGAGSGAVQRELAKLTKSRLVTVSPIGNQKHYQANPESPIYAELCSLVRKTVGLAGPLRQALLGAQGQISLALVYGSVAEGRATAASDVDLLLVSDSLTLEEVFGLLADAEHELGREIRPTLYTSKEFKRRLREGNTFLKRVLVRDVIVLIGELAHE